MCATRDRAMRGAHSWCVVEPCSSLPPKESVAGGETTVAQEGTIVNSTMLLSTDTLGRTVWVDMGWLACDERLVTVAEANALRVGGATTRLPDLR